MKRLKRAVLVPVRTMAYRCNRLHVYYWADEELYAIRAVSVLPEWYYRWLYRVSMRLVESGKFRRFADRAIHTIPYHIRFKVA
jgi:hypothetical protein